MMLAVAGAQPLGDAGGAERPRLEVSTVQYRRGKDSDLLHSETSQFQNAELCPER